MLFLIRLSIPNPNPLLIIQINLRSPLPSISAASHFQVSSLDCSPFETMADDEPMDPKKELEDRCKAPCTRPLKEYQACAKRIEGDETGQKHCTGQYFDYWRCVDKCVATKLFTYLK